MDSLVSLTDEEGRYSREGDERDKLFMIVITFSPFMISLMGITENKVVGRNQT